MQNPALNLVPDHVCLGVSDLDRAIDWYTRVLGFTLQTQWTVPELPGFRLAYIQKGDWRIELIDPGDSSPASPEPMAFDQFLRQRGYSHLCFRVDDVDATADAIKAHGLGFELEPTDFPDVQRRVAFFRDVEGNHLELAGPMKGQG